MTPEQLIEFEKLKKDLEDLNNEVYRNNFSQFQEFNKESSFTGGIQITHYDVLPSVAKVGQLAESGGNLYFCGTENVWTLK